MKKSEMEKVIEQQQQIIEAQRARVKAQNEKAKENWETVSCRLPKGTKARISAQGLTINGLINDVVLERLEVLEKNNK